MSALDRLKRVSVLVGIPSRGTWEDKFGMSLNAMISYFQSNRMGFREELVIPLNVKGSILANQRLDIVDHAIERKCTHILFVDTDQTYPRDTLHRLLKHDVDVVACNIATKQIPAQPTARFYNPNNLASGTRVYNNPAKGLEKVWRVGTGVMLLKTKIFERIGFDVFGQPWKPEVRRYQGEDWSLVEACEKAGIDVYIDHAVSEQVKHIGTYEYDHNVVGEVQPRSANG